MPISKSMGGLVPMLAAAPAQKVVGFLQWNANFMESINQEKGPKLQAMLGEAMQQVENFLQASNLPVDLEVIKQKFARLKVLYTDPFSNIESGTLGWFRPSSESIGILPDLPGVFTEKPDLHRVLVHELLHAASGRLVTNEEVDAGWSYALSHKAGYSIGSTQEGKLKWLNEALTEQLTQLVVAGSNFDYHTLDHAMLFHEGSLDKGSYRDAREFTSIFVKEFQANTGADILQALVAGYFEDYQPDNQAGERSPMWAEAVQKIGDYLRPGAVAVIDKTFNRGGSLVKKFTGNERERRLVKSLFGNEGPIIRLQSPEVIRADYKAIQTKRRQISPTRREIIAKRRNLL